MLVDGGQTKITELVNTGLPNTLISNTLLHTRMSLKFLQLS